MSNNSKEYEKVIDYICKLIESGTVKCGDRLPTERALSATIGVGRNSIREALRILDNMGITVSRQGSGNYLADNMGGKLAGVIDMMLLTQSISPQEVRNFRCYMEVTVCNMILDNPDGCAGLTEIPHILDRFQQSGNEDKVELDRQFHYTLVNATGNRMMALVMQGVMNVYRRWIDEVLRNAGESDWIPLHLAHRELYDALIAKDRMAVIKAVNAHYKLVDQLSRKNK